MAELLTTKEILAALEGIIKNAEKYICVFTYNIKIDPNYLTRLRNASKRGVRIDIVFGVYNADPQIISDLISIPNCTVYYKEYLHAKFYYNEKELLIGSMNLSDASAKNNFELAVLFKDDEYRRVISKVKQEAKEIIADAVKWEEITGMSDMDEIDFDDSQPIVGRCVRCKLEIDFNPSRPLCSHCYQIWSDWENEYYPENYCHACGEKTESVSFARPQCINCYSKNPVSVL